jgi:hypothetical protein
MKLAPPPVQPPENQAKSHRYDFRLAPEIMSALDKLASNAGLDHTAMLERLVRQAAGLAEPSAQPKAPKATPPTAKPPRLATQRRQRLPKAMP